MSGEVTEPDTSRPTAARAWAEAFLREWSRPYFGDDGRDAIACVMRAAAAADEVVSP